MKKVLPGRLFSFIPVYHVPVQPKTASRGRPRIPETVLAEAIRMRTEGASIVDIAKTLGISVGRVHGAIVADIKKYPPSQSTGEAGSTNSEESAIDGSISAILPDASTTDQPNGGN